MKIDISHLKFDERGLIPAIVQDVTTDKVLMLAYMNGQSLARTCADRRNWLHLVLVTEPAGTVEQGGHKRQPAESEIHRL